MEERTMRDDEVDNTIYKVVLNHEEQYSLWPAAKPLPKGWQLCGNAGSKEECLKHIKQAWTDMRPISLRRIKQTA